VSIATDPGGNGISVIASTPAFLFDLDGTLIDSVYQHVLAWREALEEVGLSLAFWRIHRSSIIWMKSECGHFEFHAAVSGSGFGPEAKMIG
jgi:phosphoglycolate phosphatase-like HAD superfamily hydrolase